MNKGLKCTGNFSAEELNGVTFCYNFIIILRDFIANDAMCNDNSALEFVVMALKDGRYRAPTSAPTPLLLLPPTPAQIPVPTQHLQADLYVDGTSNPESDSGPNVCPNQESHPSSDASFYH